MIDVGGEILYLMFLGMMIDVGGHSVVYWIVALFLDMLWCDAFLLEYCRCYVWLLVPIRLRVVLVLLQWKSLSCKLVRFGCE